MLLLHLQTESCHVTIISIRIAANTTMLCARSLGGNEAAARWQQTRDGGCCFAIGRMLCVVLRVVVLVICGENAWVGHTGVELLCKSCGFGRRKQSCEFVECCKRLEEREGVRHTGAKRACAVVCF